MEYATVAMTYIVCLMVILKLQALCRSHELAVNVIVQFAVRL